ncbi:hypothetical protein ACO0K0_13570 [Undibacterium sp. SXout11W]|uniref:hypothetical protein n=1 Tax=Undibacterium sp. SXout11W TaxID=3413050 RepID=UPI003BF2B06A
MNISTPSKGMQIKRICVALAGVGYTALLAGCGGGASTPAAPPPPPPTVTIDVFGARGAILTAQVTATNCSATPTVTWQTSGGVALGTGLTIQDTQPSSVISATATCSTATATENLQANQVFSSNAAFAVLQNGTLNTWGDPVWGGNSTATPTPVNNVTQVVASELGFAALINTGTVTTIGNLAIQDPTAPAPGDTATSALTNVSNIIPGKAAYFAIKKDGSFTAWGFYHGLLTEADTAMNDPQNGLSASVLASLTNIKSIASTVGAYAALKSDGTVVAFGDTDTGANVTAVQPQLTNVTNVMGTNFDFVALRKDGSVVGWGSPYFGLAIPKQTLSGVSNITLDGSAGVAKTSLGTATAFGDATRVDAADSSSVSKLLNNVTTVYATQTSFAALLSNGNVVSWGDLPRMQSSLNTVQSSLTNVASIASTEYAFAALKNDGTVVTWGDSTVGGDSNAVASQLTKVVAITANKYAFAALTANGTVVTWGMASKGGSSAVTASLNNVRAIYATPFGGFLAVNKDGSFATWGDKWAGGGTVPATVTKITFTS